MINVKRFWTVFLNGLHRPRWWKTANKSESKCLTLEHVTTFFSLLLIVCFLTGGFTHMPLFKNRQLPYASTISKYIDVKNNRKQAVINRHGKNAEFSIAHRRGFINQVGYPAVRAFQSKDNYQVLPSVVIAQAIVESNWGTSGLYLKGHNIFGVKGTYHGKSLNMKTEEDNGGKHIVMATWRKYPNFEACIIDHNNLLKNQFIGRNQDMNYKQVCKLIKANKYATDPQYANKLIATIQKYHLYRYDRIGLQD